VDHLHVMARAGPADVEVTTRRPERHEDRLERLHGRLVATDHQAIPDLEAPDPARGAGVDVLDALLREGGVTTLVVETGAPVDGRPGDSYRNVVRAGFREQYVRANWLSPR